MTRDPGSDVPNKERLDAIRRDWDTRAKEDARHYINWPYVPNEEGAFFESGRVDYERFVTSFLRRMNFVSAEDELRSAGKGSPRNRVRDWADCALDVADFATYTGVDVSPEMVRKASTYGIPHATFRAVSGGDLCEIASASVDFVFSFAVFQHVPDKAAILNYFSETARVGASAGRNFPPPNERAFLPERWQHGDRSRTDGEKTPGRDAIAVH